MCTFSFVHSSILTLNASSSHFIPRMNIGLSHLVIPQKTMNDESIARELAIQDDAHEECYRARSFLGCVNRTQKASPCVHGKPGCLGTAHHNCAAEWEFALYKVENPNGAPGDCPYDSLGKKYCIDCHPHSVRALSVPDDGYVDICFTLSFV